jgi:ABC-2 type transport system ATP-binding protein
MQGPILCAEGLAKSFGEKQALCDLSCSVAAGEIVGLLGPNGAGKTTTIKLFLGMLRPSAGHARVLGRDCTREATEVKRHVGFTPDEPSFYDFLSGKETLDFVATVRGLDPRAAWQQIEPTCKALEFEAELDRYTGSYSHGNKKKLALLVALAHAPRLLLLDEPTNGLDPPTAAAVRRLLRELSLQGTAVVVSTHLLDMADRLCDRVLLLDRGRLIFDGAPSAARAQAGLPDNGSLEDAFLALVGPR